MTEVAIREENPIAQVAVVQPAPLARQNDTQESPLVRWVDELVRADQIAQTLAKTSFVPQSLRGKPDDITAAILAGLELGLQPMATLRSIDVIQGTPALRAHAMRGLVQSHGHEVELLESTAAECVMRGRRKDRAEWQTVTWDIPRATKLGLTGKDQWRKQPQTMLIARATGEICRLIASDVLYAMPYAAEELDGDTLPDGSAPTVPRVTVDEVMNRKSAVPAPAAIEAPRPDYPSMSNAAATLEQWREVWDQARTAGHLDDALKAQLAQRGQELKGAGQDAVPSVSPSDSCGYCMQPGHFEDDCPHRVGDERAQGEYTDGGAP